MSRSASQPRIHAVVLAGGAGERFWPASRQRVPKPFLALGEDRSLIEATLDRARRFAAPDDCWVVCGEEHRRSVIRITGLPPRRVLVEPRRRNTAMAVGLAALRIAAEDPRAVMAILPADHRIPDETAFSRAMLRAARAAATADVLVTLGVRPTRPETGYGYIQVGKAVGSAYRGLHRVRRFVEKPDEARARRFLRSGGFLWNAGIFVWSAETILGEIERCAPDLHRALAPVRRTPRGRGAADAIRRAYARAPSLPVDVAILERSRRVWTLPVGFRWSDVGTWQSLAEELGVRAGQNQVLGGDVLMHDASGNLVWGHRRTIALVGVEGLAVVDTGDALLVARLDRSPAVREIVAALRAADREDLT